MSPRWTRPTAAYLESELRMRTSQLQSSLSRTGLLVREITSPENHPAVPIVQEKITQVIREMLTHNILPMRWFMGVDVEAVTVELGRLIRLVPLRRELSAQVQFFNLDFSDVVRGLTILGNEAEIQEQQMYVDRLALVSSGLVTAEEMNLMAGISNQKTPVSNVVRRSTDRLWQEVQGQFVAPPEDDAEKHALQEIERQRLRRILQTAFSGEIAELARSQVDRARMISEVQREVLEVEASTKAMVETAQKTAEEKKREEELQKKIEEIGFGRIVDLD